MNLNIPKTKPKQRKTILILGARQMQLPAFSAARKLGLYLVAVDPLNSAVGADLADKFYRSDLADEKTILSIAKQHSVNGILTLAADYPVLTVAKICQQLNLKGLSKTAAIVSTHKAKMRQALQSKGINIPQWQETCSVEQATQAVHDLASSVIVKPADSSGGRGVTLIKTNATDEDISQAFYKALTFSRQGVVMVEEFISGKEISVESITIDGKTEIVCITDKLTSEAPFFVEIGHSQPTQLSAAEIERVKQLTIAGVAALGIDNSPSHTEIRFSDDRPYIIEIGARLGGGFITSHLVPCSTGIDLVRASVQLAIGKIPDLQPQISKGAAIRFLQANPGKIVSIQGIEAARRVAGAQEVVIDLQIGDYIQSLQDATARFGYVICGGDDAPEAIERAETAKKLIVIETKG